MERNPRRICCEGGSQLLLFSVVWRNLRKMYWCQIVGSLPRLAFCSKISFGDACHSLLCKRSSSEEVSGTAPKTTKWIEQGAVVSSLTQRVEHVYLCFHEPLAICILMSSLLSSSGWGKTSLLDKAAQTLQDCGEMLVCFAKIPTAPLAPLWNIHIPRSAQPV